MPRKSDTDNETNSKRLACIEAMVVVIAETTADSHAFAVRAEEAAIRRRKRAANKALSDLSLARPETAADANV
jgi:hypothetical protein